MFRFYKRKAVIFDIDRTLIDISSLEYLFELDESDDFYPTFHAASIGSPRIEWVAQKFLDYRKSGVGVIAVTARPECFFDVTMEWFDRNNLVLDDFFMRPLGCTLNDDAMKEALLPKIRSRWNPFLAFDDKQEIINMWERNGIRGVHVGPVMSSV